MTYPDDGFYTMKGYALHSDGKITGAMEDYLEMIARSCRGGSAVRAVDISAKLHVRASSVSKMIRQLADAGLVNAGRYGAISLTEKGEALGRYLLYRHETLNRFLCLVNGTESELETAEKLEHFVDERTVKNLELLTKRLAADAEKD